MSTGSGPLFQNRVRALLDPSRVDVVSGGRKGIEKESLRVDPDGRISDDPHPEALGSALTNRFITTDYSEALLEFVTPPFTTSWGALQFLCDIHQFVYAHIGDELLWVTSMPCTIAGDESIPIARYGHSNVGMMKHIYRRGLGYRYGRTMQTIAGVHFNFSLSEDFWPVYRDLEGNSSDATSFRSAAYFALVRNFRRYSWLILYLFGASPAVCKSFIGDRSLDLEEFDDNTLYQPFATSLRMSDLGYQASSQARLDISANSMDEYIADLTRAVTTVDPEYERIGVLADGDYRQLNANILQIENEYYSGIRPKRVARSGERPTRALQRGGVEYVEVRALDLSAVDPAGVNQNQLRFLEAFLIFCMLEESPPIGEDEQAQIDRNQAVVARRGREPGLELEWRDHTRQLLTWGHQLLDGVEAVCELLDHSNEDKPYRLALDVQRERLDDPALTPSARILAEMRVSQTPFLPFALQMSEAHKAYFKELHNLDPGRSTQFQVEARESLVRQTAVEQADQIPFAEYLQQYFADD